MLPLILNKTDMLVFKTQIWCSRHAYLYRKLKLELHSVGTNIGNKLFFNIIRRSKYAFSHMSLFNEPESVKLIPLVEFPTDWAKIILVHIVIVGHYFMMSAFFSFFFFGPKFTSDTWLESWLNSIKRCICESTLKHMGDECI